MRETNESNNTHGNSSTDHTNLLGQTSIVTDGLHVSEPVREHETMKAET
jgi:hypothetical protein